MVLAAQLGTLATVHARGFDLGPGLVDDSRDGVLLPAQRRHPPGVDHVVGGDQEADLGVGGQDQHVVHVEQVVRVVRSAGVNAALADLVALAVEAAGEADRVTGLFGHVFVLPEPLIAGDLDGHRRIAGVVHRDQFAGGRERHQHQQRHRDHCPDDFEFGAVGEVHVRLGAIGLAELEHGVGHGAEDDQADCHADPQRQHVRLVGVLRGGGHALAHVELPPHRVGRLGHRRHRQQRDQRQRRQRPAAPVCPTRTHLHHGPKPQKS